MQAFEVCCEESGVAARFPNNHPAHSHHQRCAAYHSHEDSIWLITPAIDLAPTGTNHPTLIHYSYLLYTF